MLERADWTCLNGPWQFAFDPDARWRDPDEIEWNHTIMVPFSPETPAGGLANTGFHKACWYRRELQIAVPGSDRRALLRFGAIHYSATIWVNRMVARHEGDTLPFFPTSRTC